MALEAEIFSLKDLVAQVHDSDSLCDLLRGLGWPVLPEFAFKDEPFIAQGVKGAKCEVQSLIPASVDDPRLFLLVEFHEPYVRRDLREVLASLRRYTRDTAKWPGKTGTGDTIFLVASPGYEDVRFVLFEEQDRRLPRIRSFGWRREFVGRTVLTHNLERLRWGEDWKHAWDVEGLTERFYKDYEEVFAAVLSKVHGAPDERTKHSWTQLLFNRLLFLAFIQRMGWLRMPGGSADGYLFDLYRSPEKKTSVYGKLRAVFAELDRKEDHPYKNREAEVIGRVPYLNGGLFDQDDPLDRPDISVPDDALALVLAEPSGLFARYNFTVTESTPLDQEVAVDPEMLGKIFERLIIAEERHKTGTYYTPRPIVEFMVNEAIKGYLVDRGLAADKAAMLVDDDKIESEALSFRPTEMQDALDWLFEVRAVDPACGSGAYLLMLLQRLFELVDRLEISRDKRRNVNQKHLYETKLRLLQRCIYGVDLNETAVRIARLRMWLSLVVENKGEKPEPLPNFDFLIMQGDALASPLFPIQGVLGYPHAEVKEYTRMKRRYFHPGPDEQRPTRAAMQAQRSKISAAFSDDLSNSRLRSLSSKPFDWEVEFAEVFNPDDSEETLGARLNLGLEGANSGQGELAARVRRLPGFDIVVANPPYVNSGELLKSVGPAYKAALTVLYKTGSGTADLLVFFLERAMQLLRQDGVFAFITSNKWLKAGYGKKLRMHLATDASVTDLIDFQDGRVFQDVICYPLITIARKSRRKIATIYTSLPRPERDSSEPELLAFRRRFGYMLQDDGFTSDGNWQLETGDGADRLTLMRTHGMPLGQYVKSRIFYGVKTGLNEVKIGSDGQMYGKFVPAGVKVVRKEGVFVIDGRKRTELITEDPRSAEIIKPLAIGRDICRWAVANNDRWLIVTKIGTDITRYPAIMRHLSRFESLLRPRSDQGNQWWELRACSYWNVFEQSRLVYQRFQVQPLFMRVPAGTYVTDAIYMLGTDETYLLGVMNSQPFWLEVKRVCPAIQNGHQLLWEQFSRAIVPNAGLADKAEIETRVNSILSLKQAQALGSADLATNEPNVLPGSEAQAVENEISKLEAEIDRRVDFLYFHRGERGSRKKESGEEVPFPDTYDEWVALQEAEKGTAAEAVRKLISGDESGTVEFKETLEYVDRVPQSIPEDKRAQWKANKQKECVEGVLKTICAFYNSRGGTLLIGVNDTKEIIGLAPDFSMLGQKQNRDGFELKLKELLKRLRPLPTDLNIDFPELDGKTICRIVVTASRVPHYLDNRLFVRFGNSSEEQTGRDLQDWLLKRQEAQGD